MTTNEPSQSGIMKTSGNAIAAQDGSRRTSKIAMPDPQAPSAGQTIMERRGFARPQLNDMDSSFSRTSISVECTDQTPPVKALESIHLSTPTKEEDRRDVNLLNAVRNEVVSSTPNLKEYLSSPFGPSNPYHEWTCGFGMQSPPDMPLAAASSKQEFLKSVKDELSAMTFIRHGLSKYLLTINSGKHHVFPSGFLEDQKQAADIAFAQLDKIKEHLDDVVREVQGNSPAGNAIEDVTVGKESVSSPLREIYAHARPWIARVRAIVVQSHVFYKINYALAADRGNLSKSEEEH